MNPAHLLDAWRWTPAATLVGGAVLLAGAGLAWPVERRSRMGVAGLALAAVLLELDRSVAGLHPAGPALVVAAAGLALLVLGPRAIGRVRPASALVVVGAGLVVVGLTGPTGGTAAEVLRQRMASGRRGDRADELYLVLSDLPGDRWFGQSGFRSDPVRAVAVLAARGRVEDLVDCLAADDPFLRFEAATALAALGDRRAGPVLRAGWDPEAGAADEAARRRAAALGALGDRDALDWLVSCHRARSSPPPSGLDRRKERVLRRWQAGHRASLEAAAAALEPELALEFLIRTGGAGGRAILARAGLLERALARPELASAVVAALAGPLDRPGPDPRLDAALEAARSHRDPAVARAARRVLFVRGRRDLAASLSPADLEDARALALGGDPAGRETLREALGRRSSRAGAAVALAVLGDAAGRAVVEELLEAGGDPALVDLCRVVRPDLAGCYRALIETADPAVARRAVRALASLGAADLLDVIRSRPLRGAAEDRAWAALLVEIDRVAPDGDLIDLLADPAGPDFALAAWTAGLGGRPGALAVAASHLGPDARPLVAWADLRGR